MIRKLELRNFKQFETARFEFDKRHVVIVGPNNCGKTTLLQAVAIWSEICDVWMSDGSRMMKSTGDGEHGDVEIGQLESLPYRDFGLMWRNQDTRLPIVLSLSTNRWSVAFEMRYVDKSTLRVRPSRDVADEQLNQCKRHPVRTLYVPPFSGLERQEAQLVPEGVLIRLVQDMLHGRGGGVLRNMLLAISEDKAKWNAVQLAIRDLFGCELTHPSGIAEIMVGYRQAKHDRPLDIACGARGFLQVLFVYASLHYFDSSVIMMDEPDSHLYLSLQENLYNRIKAFAQSEDRQLIVVTHSDLLMNIAGRDLRTLTSDGLDEVVDKSVVGSSLRSVRPTEILLAKKELGILYVEGETDLKILREWARSLSHSALRFLEAPLRRDTAGEKDRAKFAKEHFRGLRLHVPTVRGIVLEDRNGKDDARRHQQRSVDGLTVLTWMRYDIENYLIHPQTLLRFIRERTEIETDVAEARKFMEEYYTPLYRDPFEDMRVLKKVKGRELLSEILDKAKVYCEDGEYHEIAGMMLAEEVHPEVQEVLDAIAEKLGSTAAQP